MKPLGQFEVWFVTGSQDLYGSDALRQVEANAACVAEALDDAAAIPVRVVFKPGRRLARGDRRDAASRRTPATPASGSSPGCTPSRRPGCGSPASRRCAKPLLHLHTQFNRDLPWGEIDMDFMNLNQAAHGDREFGYIETRLRVARKTVAGHWQDPYVADRDRRLVPRGLRLARGPSAARSPASATTCARSPTPRATRSRPRSASA